MADLSTVEARNQFADLVNRVAYGKEQIILTRRGKALVAVVPIEDIQLLEAATREMVQPPQPEVSEDSSLFDSKYTRLQSARSQEHV